jgi:DNA-binding transcriptional MocR family regulator
MLAAERLRVLTTELRARLPEWSFPSPAGGLSVWVSLPGGSVEELVQRALRRGVAISSGTAAAPDDRFSGYVRLCAGPAPELIREGVGELASAWESISPDARPALPEPSIVR